MPMKNAFAPQFGMGQHKQTPMPEPDMQEAGKMGGQQPSPFPQSGFAKQGMMTSKSPLPKLMGET